MHRFRPMSADDAAVIAAWHYREPYTFYDVAADATDLAELLGWEHWQPDSHFAVAESGDDLVGFFTFEHGESEVVEIGLGLRPDRTGRGQGTRFIEAGLRFDRSRYRPTRFTLAVAAFNQRAISVYQRVGFVETRRFVQHTNGGAFDFVQMTLNAAL